MNTIHERYVLYHTLKREWRSKNECVECVICDMTPHSQSHIVHSQSNQTYHTLAVDDITHSQWIIYNIKFLIQLCLFNRESHSLLTCHTLECVMCQKWVCGMCYSYSSVWYDLFECVIWLIRVCIRVCDMTYSSVWYDLFECVFECVIWLIRVCDMTYSSVWYDLFECVIWLIRVCGMSYSIVNERCVIVNEGSCHIWMSANDVHEGRSTVKSVWYDSFNCEWTTCDCECGAMSHMNERRFKVMSVSYVTWPHNAHSYVTWPHVSKWWVCDTNYSILLFRLWMRVTIIWVMSHRRHFKVSHVTHSSPNEGSCHVWMSVIFKFQIEKRRVCDMTSWNGDADSYLKWHHCVISRMNERHNGVSHVTQSLF